MGTVSFQIPPGLPAPLVRELERACLIGGPDNMPWPTEIRLEGDRLLARRTVDESGYLVTPWDLEGLGRLMGTSATLMERAAPYQLPLELARGKVNQLRNQAADWRSGGLQIPESLDQRIREVGYAFGRTVIDGGADPAVAQQTLALAHRASAEMVSLYVEQVFRIRQQRQAKLDTTLGCRLDGSPPKGATSTALARAFNAACVSPTWKDVEPSEGTYRWDVYDGLLGWCAAEGLTVTAGPLIDFSSAALPDWLWLWERDLPSLLRFMSQYVEGAIRRYRGIVRRWQLTAASNCAAVLSLGEDELLWLTVQLADAARQVDPGIELSVGIAQPWGEYMAVEDRIHSPFIFADTLIRAGLNLASLDLELVMGVTPRGSYCRDLLDTSRLLDLYALLGVPLRLTLGYPSTPAPDAKADPDLRVSGGFWPGGFSSTAQADWAGAVTPLAACKPYVQGVLWSHVSDAAPHTFPHCGLVGSDEGPKPLLERLTEVRHRHLR